MHTGTSRSLSVSLYTFFIRTETTDGAGEDHVEKEQRNEVVVVVGGIRPTFSNKLAIST